MDKGVRQHKRMAAGEKIEGEPNFGCAPLRSGIPHPDRNISSKPLGDGERANPPGISRGASMMEATHDSDHGPHHHREP